MELETNPAAAGTESTDLCAIASALAYPSSSGSSHVFTKIPSSWCLLILLINQHKNISSVIWNTRGHIQRWQLLIKKLHQYLSRVIWFNLTVWFTPSLFNKIARDPVCPIICILSLYLFMYWQLYINITKS